MQISSPWWRFTHSPTTTLSTSPPSHPPPISTFSSTNSVCNLLPSVFIEVHPWMEKTYKSIACILRQNRLHFLFLMSSLIFYQYSPTCYAMCYSNRNVPVVYIGQDLWWYQWWWSWWITWWLVSELETNLLDGPTHCKISLNYFIFLRIYSFHWILVRLVKMVY